MKTIHFVWVELGETVHAGVLGFTTRIDKFVQVDTEDQIEPLVREWLATKGVRFERILSVSLAINQDRESYVFPENILT